MFPNGEIRAELQYVNPEDVDTETAIDTEADGRQAPSKGLSRPKRWHLVLGSGFLSALFAAGATLTVVKARAPGHIEKQQIKSADNEVPAILSPGVGCSNWEKILSEATNVTDFYECAATCQGTSGCVQANYQACPDSDVANGTCYLFTGDCSQEVNVCWMLWTPVSAEAAHGLPKESFQAFPENTGMEYAANPSLEELYLSTLRDSITGTALRTPSFFPDLSPSSRIPFNDSDRNRGLYWCGSCYSMAGNIRLQLARELVETTITENVPGDFVETGIWRGGLSIFARAVQRVHNASNRRVYGCDSFSGLPRASTADDGDDWSMMDALSVSMEEGRNIAVLRGDGDMYESYMDILYNLYEFVPVGGYFICDDCPGIAEAEKAVQEFRARHSISDEVQTGDGNYGTYWRKSQDVDVDYPYYLTWNATRNLDANPAAVAASAVITAPATNPEAHAGAQAEAV